MYILESVKFVPFGTVDCSCTSCNRFQRASRVLDTRGGYRKCLTCVVLRRNRTILLRLATFRFMTVLTIIGTNMNILMTVPADQLSQYILCILYDFHKHFSNTIISNKSYTEYLFNRNFLFDISTT